MINHIGAKPVVKIEVYSHWRVKSPNPFLDTNDIFPSCVRHKLCSIIILQYGTSNPKRCTISIAKTFSYQSMQRKSRKRWWLFWITLTYTLDHPTTLLGPASRTLDHPLAHLEPPSHNLRLPSQTHTHTHWTTLSHSLDQPLTHLRSSSRKPLTTLSYNLEHPRTHPGPSSSTPWSTLTHVKPASHNVRFNISQTSIRTFLMDLAPSHEKIVDNSPFLSSSDEASTPNSLRRRSARLCCSRTRSATRSTSVGSLNLFVSKLLVFTPDKKQEIVTYWSTQRFFASLHEWFLVLFTKGRTSATTGGLRLTSVDRIGVEVGESWAGAERIP